jgi:hypothetical protein
VAVLRPYHAHRSGCRASHDGVPATRTLLYSGVVELVFEIRDGQEGGLYARAMGHGIFTEAENWDELRANVLEAVALHFEDAATRPRLGQMRYVKDGSIP